MELDIDTFKKEIERIVEQCVKKYVSNHLDTSYFGTISSITADGEDSRPEVDIGFAKIRMPNLSGADIAVGNRVLVKVHGDKFNNAYIDKKYSDGGVS